MRFPTATRKSAFLAGASLGFIASLLGVLKSRGLTSINADSPEVFPALIAYFFITAIVFVIDVKSFAPKELKTRIPLVYFPTNSEGFRYIVGVWGRMLVWFLGAVAAIMPFMLLELLPK